MTSDGSSARQRLPVSIMAVLVAGGLLLVALTTSWALVQGRAPDLQDAAKQECSVHLRNYQELHKQVVELAGLYPVLNGVLTKSQEGSRQHRNHQLRRLLRLMSEAPVTETRAEAQGPDSGTSSAVGADTATPDLMPTPEAHHAGHHGRHECLAQVADLHARVYYALRLVSREAHTTQEMVKASAAKAEKMEAEIARLRQAAAAQVAAPAPAAVPQQEQKVGDSKWNSSLARLATGVVVGTPVRYQGQEQFMVVPVNDEYVGADIRKTQAPYQQDLLEVMTSFIRFGSTVLDVGGNLGTYAIWFARAVGPRGHVYSFEAQTFIYQVLTTNLLINGHRNVHTLRTAVSFKAGVTHMGDKLADGSAGGKNFSEVAADKLDKPINYGGRSLGEGGEEVPMITIDSLNLTNISFIKLDIQGAEPLAVYGAQQTIIKNKPVVSVENEAHAFFITKEMIRDMGIPPAVQNFSIQGFLRSQDYRVVHIHDYDEVWVPPGYEHPQYGWSQGGLSVKHLKAGLRGGKEFGPEGGSP